MKPIVFGGNGFIGSHVATQLHHSGHKVTAVIRPTSDATFLEKQGIHIMRIDYSNRDMIRRVMIDHDVVYNCTASAGLQVAAIQPHVELALTKELIQTAAMIGIRHFIQLSSIVIYGFERDGLINESYQPVIHYPVQQIQQTREAIVTNIAEESGMRLTIVRPASTIGARGERSFFANLFKLRQVGKFPIVDKGQATTSFIDTRDIGRAMTFLGERKESGTYLLKGFDASWWQLKTTIDAIIGQKSDYITLSGTLSDAQLHTYGMNPYAYHTFSINRTWDDTKIRDLGFRSTYSLQEAAEQELDYLMKLEN
ncbi:MAG: NAD-dependent epimerase/dehydratase family protein [Sporolactobacillus sp.]